MADHRTSALAGLTCAALGAAATFALMRWPRRQKSPWVIVVCGPSGAGKGTLIEALRAKHPGKFAFTTSHTTRAPRKNEVDGVHYHFVDKEKFLSMKKKSKFVENAEVHGNFYGTSKEAIEKVMATGQHAILDIDIQGANQIHAMIAEMSRPVRFVFVQPPSVEELKQRLEKRGTETEESIKKRLANAVGEISQYSVQTYWRTVVNNDLDIAMRRFEALLLQPWDD
jgi:guanylate kinase